MFLGLATFSCVVIYIYIIFALVAGTMMMFAQRIEVLTHDLKHQCRIGDMSNCPASCIANAAPYLQGSYSLEMLLYCDVYLFLLVCGHVLFTIVWFQALVEDSQTIMS